MQGNTHRVGGALSAILGVTVLGNSGMLLPEVSPFIQLCLIYPFALYGSVISDLDHGEQSIPVRDPLSIGVNKVLHLTSGLRKKGVKRLGVLSVFDAKHRSWQTHSDLFLFGFIALWIWLLNTGGTLTGIGLSMGDIGFALVKLMLTGLLLGVVSHLVLDSITPEGIWFIIPTIVMRRKVSFRLVPKARFFATGGPWEKLVRTIMWVVIMGLFLYHIYLALPYRIHFG